MALRSLGTSRRWHLGDPRRPKKFLYSQLRCWVAMERAVRLATRRGLPAQLERWQNVRDAKYRRIMDTVVCRYLS